MKVIHLCKMKRLRLVLSLLCFVMSVMANDEFMKESFSEMDLNKDGYLEKEEMIPYMAEGFKKLAVMNAGWMFDLVDTDKNELLDHDEITNFGLKKTVAEIKEELKENKLKRVDKMIYLYEQQKFKICDKNKDGKLSRNEHWYFLNSAAALPRFEHENMWAEYDLNKDGKVLFEEFHNPEYKSPSQSPEQQKASDQEFFNSRDLNHDRILDFAEVREMTSPDRNGQAVQHIDFIMDKYDSNKDKKLSKDEYMKSTEDMTLFDGPEITPPKLRDDDVEGYPKEPESKIDYEVFVAKGKDEL